MDEHSRSSRTVFDAEAQEEILEEIKDTPLEPSEMEESVDLAMEELDREREEEEESDLPEWDGTDSALVADDDAQEFEEPMSGIHISYCLRHEEIKTALRRSGVFRFSVRKMIIQSAVLLCVAGLFLATYLTAQIPRPETLVVAGVCAALTAAVWLMPEYQLAARARQLRSDKPVEAEIFPDEIKVGRGEGAWSIPLDGTSEYKEIDGLLVVVTPHKRCVAFPVRSIEPALLHDVVAMLAAGTEA